MLVFRLYLGTSPNSASLDARNPLGVDWLGEIGDAAFTLFLFVPLVVAIGVASLVCRFRRSSVWNDSG